MTEPRRTRDGATSTRRGGQRPIDPEAERFADLEARLRRLEKGPGLRARGRGLVAKVVPDEATQHFLNAGREQLLGVRAIVDFWIERIDAVEAGKWDGGSRREAIEIEA
jgi:hypothetical protein